MNARKTISAIIVLVVSFSILGYGIYGAEKSSIKNTKTSVIPQNTAAPTPTTAAKVSTPVVADTTKRVSKYKNGTYSATGTYDSPAGLESIGVSLTIANDIVTNTSVTPEPSDRTSSRYQQMFANGYKTYVIGQNIDTIALDRVSGSSLTPIGFNNALAKIKAEAQA